ncbi:MAG: signal peptidase I [Terriglobia bacterium]
MINPGQQLRGELVAQALRTSGTVRLRVFGGSMRPWLRPGDILLVRREHPVRVRPGEIVLYARGGALFAHRVIRKGWQAGQPLLVTKGDAFPEADPAVSSEELLGRVARVLRGRREINLESWRQLSLGRFLAFLSASSRWLYRIASVVERVCFSRRQTLPLIQATPPSGPEG